MAKFYTITETIISASAPDQAAIVSSSLQTWTYSLAEHAQLAFASILDELKTAYPKGTDQDWTIQHTETNTTLTIAITIADAPSETIVVTFVEPAQHRELAWWTTLATQHDAQVMTRFTPAPSQSVITKSLLSGQSPADEDGLASALQTWTYENDQDATEDFQVLTRELVAEYPQGVHEDGFEVRYEQNDAQTLTIQVTLDGEPYETIQVCLQTVTAKSAQPWWLDHQNRYLSRLH